MSISQISNIEWCDCTWNPVSGCLHGCPYCYARDITRRFGGHTDVLHASEHPEEYEGTPIHVLDGPLVNGDHKAIYPFHFEPTLYRYVLDDVVKAKAPRNIFVCSMADLFGAWVPDQWISEVLDACRRASQHRYMFLTKNPDRYEELADAGLLVAEDNFWYGASVPTPLAPYWHRDGYNTFVSIEPLLEPFQADAPVLKDVKWVIVGALTGPGRAKRQPERSWVQAIMKGAEDAGTAIFLKNSLRSTIGVENMVQEFPWKPDGRERWAMVNAKKKTPVCPQADITKRP